MDALDRAACLLGAASAAVAAAGCGATSHRSAVHHLVGPTSTRPRVLVAKLSGSVIHKAPPFGPARATIEFTVGERGLSPGTGIPKGSVISVFVTGKRPGNWMIKAYGRDGHYTANLPVPPGGIRSVQVGGFLNVRSGSSLANGDYWIPVTLARGDY